MKNLIAIILGYKSHSERVACKIITISEDLNDKHLKEMADYLQALIENRESKK